MAQLYAEMPRISNTSPPSYPLDPDAQEKKIPQFGSSHTKKSVRLGIGSTFKDFGEHNLIYPSSMEWGQYIYGISKFPFFFNVPTNVNLNNFVFSGKSEAHEEQLLPVSSFMKKYTIHSYIIGAGTLSVFIACLLLLDLLFGVAALAPNLGILAFLASASVAAVGRIAIWESNKSSKQEFR